MNATVAWVKRTPCMTPAAGVAAANMAQAQCQCREPGLLLTPASAEALLKHYETNTTDQVRFCHTAWLWTNSLESGIGLGHHISL